MRTEEPSPTVGVGLDLDLAYPAQLCGELVSVQHRVFALRSGRPDFAPFATDPRPIVRRTT
jgi:hypothetical protein